MRRGNACRPRKRAFGPLTCSSPARIVFCVSCPRLKSRLRPPPQGWLSKLLNYGYWVGTIALRLGLQPYLLVRTAAWKAEIPLPGNARRIFWELRNRAAPAALRSCPRVLPCPRCMLPRVAHPALALAHAPRLQRTSKLTCLTRLVCLATPQYWFWDATRKYDPVDRFIVMCSQSFLCVFNVGLVILALIARCVPETSEPERGVACPGLVICASVVVAALGDSRQNCPLAAQEGAQAKARCGRKSGVDEGAMSLGALGTGKGGI